MNKLALDRWQKHPHQPTAGSIFKNIPLTDEIVKKIENKGFKLPEKFIEYKKIPAAWLIECLDLKGKQIGGAQISTQHANHLANLDKAKADEVVQLISLVKTKVRDEFGIQLEEEVRYVGF
jgi:UDP-N-acetylenolpyruvoylglucosamine reductase